MERLVDGKVKIRSEVFLSLEDQLNTSDEVKARNKQALLEQFPSVPPEGEDLGEFYDRQIELMREKWLPLFFMRARNRVKKYSFEYRVICAGLPKVSDKECTICREAGTAAVYACALSKLHSVCRGCFNVYMIAKLRQAHIDNIVETGFCCECTALPPGFYEWKSV
ncbi:MAG: hypothetical protein LVR00_05875 [Rhabdochlamydiaceae bacterium]